MGKKLYDIFRAMTMKDSCSLLWEDLPDGVQKAWDVCYDQAFRDGHNEDKKMFEDQASIKSLANKWPRRNWALKLMLAKTDKVQPQPIIRKLFWLVLQIPRGR